MNFAGTCSSHFTPLISESSSAGRKVEPLFPTVKNITCYECHSEFDGPMCYNESQFTTEARICTQSIVKGGGCAVSSNNHGGRKSSGKTFRGN